MLKPSNLTPAESALWDKMESAATTGTPAFAGTELIGIGNGTPGLVHYLAVERCLEGAASEGLDPVDWCNGHVQEIAGYYELLVAALKAAGFGANSPILDTTRPLFDQEPATLPALNAALAALPVGTSVILTLRPDTVTELIAGGYNNGYVVSALVALVQATLKGKKK